METEHIAFITPDFEHIIRENVIKDYLPNLNVQHRELLYKYLYGVIQMLASAHDFYSNRDEFIIKLKQNLYNDLKWLLTLIIPYIGNNTRYIKSLEDLYTSTTNYNDETLKNAYKFNAEPINFATPKYKFSNLQYGRCIRGEAITSIHFDEAHIYDNYILLLKTIWTTRHKLHINWIDIIPYTLNTYKNTKLYIDTKERFDTFDIVNFDPIIDYPIDNKEHVDILNNKMKGLNIEDIYNTISNDLYTSIIDYKWLLFIDVISIRPRRTISYIELLQIFYTEEIFKNDEYEPFKNKWSELVEAYRTQTSKNGISHKIIKNFVNTLILFFNNTLKTYIIKKTPTNDNINETNIRLYDKIISQIIISISAQNIFKFIQKSIKYIKASWYSYRLFNHDKTNIIYPNTKISLLHGVHYFCKQIVHILKLDIKNIDLVNQRTQYSDVHTRLPYTWDELDDIEQQIFFDRLNNNNQNIFFDRTADVELDITYPRKEERTHNWFTMEIYGHSSLSAVFTNNMYYTIRQYITDILFETLICKGSLSYIIPAVALTDRTKYDITNETHKKKLIKKIENMYFNNKDYKDYAYYYLTNIPYGKIKNFDLLVNGKVETFDYFKICTTPKYVWYTAYPFNWISQIGFCHRFINTRVSYVTGATGTGKTAHMPKIYMYYLKIIDNIFDPTVIVTVPRIPIIKKQVDFMSESLAVPVTVYNKKLKRNITSGNTFVQGEYKGSDRNITSHNIDLKIKFVTDGTIVRELRKNDLLKQHGKNGIYKNKYDVIIIDEAHEHNINMDMILTLIRNIIYYNNSLRLVIMSATIDEDEMYYRRFYRDINDNRKYPLNMFIAKYNIDRINIDRRWHFSGISSSTTYDITEIYRPGTNVIDIVTEIIKNNNYNGILIFYSGRNDIIKTVGILNSQNILPSTMIALPYYAKLNDTARNVIDKIDNMIKQITINKNDVATTYLTEQTLIGSGNGIYTKYVLVATNIAEASLTINSLTHVIDTGIEKHKIYNIYSKVEILTHCYINESSRIQRKGRIGRVAPGTIYYTYAKNAINTIRPYKISNEDIKYTLYDYLCEKGDIPLFINLVNSVVNTYNINTILIEEYKYYKDNHQHMINKENAHNYISTFDIQSTNTHYQINNKQAYYTLMLFNSIYNIYNTNNTDEVKKKRKKKIQTLIDIIVAQYFVSDKLYLYYGNPLHYDYKNMKIPIVHYTGFTSNDLSDKLGTFYFIHPDENIFVRNINGNIIRTRDENMVSLETNKCRIPTYIMCSKKMCLYWEMLLNSAFITVDSSNVYKTQLGVNISTIINILEGKEIDKESITTNIYIIMIYGIGLSCSVAEHEIIIILCALLHQLNENTYIKEIYMPVKQQYSFNELSIIIKNKNKHIKNIIGNKMKCISSDIHILHHIVSLLLNILDQYKEIPFIPVVQGITQLHNTTFENEAIIKEKINNDRKRNENYNNTHLDSIINNNKSVIENVGIDIQFIKNILKKVFYFKQKQNIMMTHIMDIKNKFKPLRQYIDMLNIDLIKAVIMLVYPYNIKHKIYGSRNSYVSIYSPTPEYIYTLDLNKTFVEPESYQNYILNIYSNNKTIYLILNITLNDIKLLSNIYNRQELHRKYYINNIKYEHRFYIDKYIDDMHKNNIFTINDIYEYTQALGNLNKTIQHIHNDLLQIDNSNEIFTILNNYHDPPYKIAKYYTLLNGI